MQISFFKHLLGINSRSTNWAVLSETNSKPILCKIILKIVRYWERIKESPSPILKVVLITNKQFWKKKATLHGSQELANNKNILGK